MKERCACFSVLWDRERVCAICCKANLQSFINLCAMDMDASVVRIRRCTGIVCHCRRVLFVLVATLVLFGRMTDAQSSSSVLPLEQSLPRLIFLGLRCSDRPIDLRPPFSPTHYVYQASLDFSDGSFAVDAIPAIGMTISDMGALQTTRFIPPGDQHRVDIRVRNPATDQTNPYTVTVGRLDGRSVRVRALAVPGSTLTPLFDPMVLDYSVRLPAEQERLLLRFVPWDTGQIFEVTSSAAAWAGLPSTTATTTALAPPTTLAALGPPELQPRVPVVEGDGSPARRLDVGEEVQPVPSGEAQYSVLSRLFPVDLATSRLVTVRVRPANGDAVVNQTYSFQTTRAACPAAFPLFAPDLRACTMTCNLGFFADRNVGRCLSCASHCMRCSAWDSCQRCEPSQLRVLYFVRLTGGYCRVVHIPWLRILGGLCGATVLLSVCCCLSRGLVEHQRKKKAVLRARRGKTLQSERLLRASEGFDHGYDQSDDE